MASNRTLGRFLYIYIHTYIYISQNLGIRPPLDLPLDMIGTMINKCPARVLSRVTSHWKRFVTNNRLTSFNVIVYIVRFHLFSPFSYENKRIVNQST